MMVIPARISGIRWPGDDVRTDDDTGQKPLQLRYQHGAGLNEKHTIDLVETGWFGNRGSGERPYEAASPRCRADQLTRGSCDPRQ